MPHDSFAFHEKKEPLEYTGLDHCIDHSCEADNFSIAKLIRGHKPKRTKTKHLKPIAVVRFNSKLGKAKPI